MTPSALVLKTLGPWLALIFSTAHAAHVDPHTLGAIVYLESRGQPHLVAKERNGTCSVGLGMVNVPDCDPVRISSLQDPAFNLRVAALVLRANQRWCRRHPSEWRCRAGNRVMKNGGALNTYAGWTTSYAPKVKKRRMELLVAMRRCKIDPSKASWRRALQSCKR